MLHRIPPQGFDFPDRALAQMAVLNEQFPRRAHLGVPGMAAGGFLAGFPVVHPADHDAPPIGGKHRLRRVKIQAVIHRLNVFPLKPAVFFVPVAQDADCAEARVEFFPGVHFLGADQQHLGAVQREKVRAFPHPSVLFPAGVDFAYEMPVQAVPAFHKQHGSRSFFVPVAHHHAIRTVFFPPYLGIAEVKFAVAFRQMGVTDHGVHEGFFKIHAVPEGDALRLRFPAESACWLNACITEHELSIRHFHGTAGKAATRVGSRIGCQGTGHVRPMQQIITDGMAPMHRPPLPGKGMILIEQMILPFVPAESIGVVHPAHQRRQME